jgi:hypothetical protein
MAKQALIDSRRVTTSNPQKDEVNLQKFHIPKFFLTQLKTVFQGNKKHAYARQCSSNRHILYHESSHLSKGLLTYNIFYTKYYSKHYPNVKIYSR